MQRLSLDNEISQENNPNATAHLFIQDNGLLFKKYFLFNDLTRKNIENLLAIADNPELRTIGELALPVEIIKEDGRVIGYTMPYFRGKTLLSCMDDPSLPFAFKLSCFSRLAKVIMRLPDGISIGDLHMKNVIVDESGDIHIVDIDGFSVKDVNTLSCPLSFLIKKDARLRRGKYMANGSVKVGRDTDILCFFDAFLYFIIGGVYFTMYSQKCFSEYLDYLEGVSFPVALLDDIRTLFSDGPNRITLSAFDEIDAEKSDLFSFRAYADSIRKRD